MLQGFDEVLAALPASANMGNLLLELGEVMSAALGVLVSRGSRAEQVCLHVGVRAGVSVLVEVRACVHACVCLYVDVPASGGGGGCICVSVCAWLALSVHECEPYSTSVKLAGMC